MLVKASFCFMAFAASLQSLSACNVPVFRYALERWPPESFDVVIFYRGTLEPAQKNLADLLEHSGRSQSANVEITLADLDTRLDPLLQKVWEMQTNAMLPLTVILPPRGEEAPTPLWSGRLDSNTVAQLVDSPLRRELAKRLLRGDSAVWLLLESGDKRLDDPLAELLSQELAGQERQITLPPPDPEDPKMHATLPLRIAFSMIRASRNDPAEALFVKMLLHGETLTNAGPVLFPIFGRGRALATLSGSELTPKVIRDASRFICGACSCEVKELNPGKDLLLAANWNSIFAPQLVTTAQASAGSVLTNPPVPAGQIALNKDLGKEMMLSVVINRRAILGMGIIIAAALVLITGAMLFRSGAEK